MNSCLDITNTGEKERGRREMSNVGSNNKQFLITQLMWLGISFGISITISILIPFPISLVTIIAVFIMLNLYMRKRMMQRMGMTVVAVEEYSVQCSHHLRQCLEEQILH